MISMISYSHFPYREENILSKSPVINPKLKSPNSFRHLVKEIWAFLDRYCPLLLTGSTEHLQLVINEKQTVVLIPFLNREPSHNIYHSITSQPSHCSYFHRNSEYSSLYG